MAQPFFHQRQQLGIIACFGVKDALRRQPGLIETRREQVARAHHPQHRTPGARHDAGDEQRRRGIVPPARTLACDLVQRIEPHAAIRQPGVHRLDPERQHRASATGIALDRSQRLPQLGQGGYRG